MDEYVYRYSPERKINDTTTQMSAVEVFNTKTHWSGCYHWGRKPSEDQIKTMVSQLISDHEISKIWNRK